LIQDIQILAYFSGESGVFVGKINKKRAVNAFHGYADKKASEKKILTNVFEHGDTVFNSGDILVMDELGYFYFKDRTGDTFRYLKILLILKGLEFIF
jgi:solute carrier family 27 (fatty acid transporter), member 1/4